MSQFFTDFSELATGAGIPSGWTAQWATTNQTWTVVADGAATGGKYLRLAVTTTANRALSMNAAGTPGTVETLARVRMVTEQFTSRRAELFVRGAGSAGSENAYTSVFGNASGANRMALQKHLSGTQTQLAGGTFPNYAYDTWYWVRTQATGTTIRMKWWSGAVTDEPVSWYYSVTDSSLASGWVGIGGYTAGINYDFDVFSVGTNGDAAPSASLNTAPTISVAPSVSYGSLTRLGPNNTPAVLSFTATDPEETGTNALSYTIRTAATGGGTLVGSGTATSGVSKQHNIANSASGLVDGTQTLYLRVFDGVAYSADSSFTLLRDTGAPSVGTIVVTPNPVTP